MITAQHPGNHIRHSVLRSALRVCARVPRTLVAIRCKYDFANAHVLITGGASGIGLELAKQCQSKGASVSVLDVSIPSGTVRGLSGCDLGDRVVWHDADVGDPVQVASAVADSIERFGDIDVVVANAGISKDKCLLDMPLEDYVTMDRVNHLGVVITLKAVVPRMVERGKGKAVIVSSAAGLTSNVGAPAYCATKFAVRAVAESLRYELLGSGVDVHIAMPTFIDTPLVRKAFDNAGELGSAATRLQREIKPKAYPVDESVARMLYGIENGMYLLPSCDTFSDKLLASSATGPSSPKSLPLLLHMLLSPFMVLLHFLYNRYVEAVCLEEMPKARQRSLHKG